MDEGPNGSVIQNHGISQLDLLSIKYLGSMVSLAAGSLCVTLVVMYRQDKATLIVMACSNLLYGLGFFALCLLYVNRRDKTYILSVSQLACICIELITLGAAVCHFNNGRKNSIAPNTHLHQNLVTALDSLLLFTLFINGMAIASLKAAKTADESSLSQQDCDSALQDAKFIPLKNSSQTLTPSMEIFQNIQSQCGSKGWHLNNAPTTHSSDDISFPSVVKHKLDCLSSREASPVSSISRKASGIKSRLRSSSGSSSPRRSRSLLSRLRSSKLKTTMENRKRNFTGSEATNKNINGRYVTRLSTIPDLSRSVLNVILSSSDGPSRQDKTADLSRDQNMRHSSILPDPALELERDAIERINSALLPPCLKIMETPPPSEKSTVTKPEFAEASRAVTYNEFQDNVHSSPDMLEINDLGEIPQIPAANHGSMSGSSADFELPADFPQLLTMDMWRENKDQILARAGKIQNRTLLPAFDLGSPDLTDQNVQNVQVQGPAFSFPSKSCPVDLNTKATADQKDFDTISALEEYFRDLNEHEEEEMQIIEEGLKHDLSTSAVAGNVSKEIIRTSTRHSPTKSMISIISAASQQRSQTMRNSYLNATGDARPSTGILSASVKTSPTRSQRLKRIGKKLSLSNISDTMINHSITSDTTGELFGSGKHDHMRGKSIDFSYVHNLQSNHSPTKSTSGQSMCGSSFKDRRHSMAADHGLRTASGLFSLQNGTSTANFGPDPTTNTTWNEQLSEAQDSSHSASSEPSSSSTTDYPDIVMSEYDRERWNTILRLNLNDQPTV